jgi:acetyl-CoA carboxylase carboxyltransferase component
MTILDTALDPRASSFLENRSTALAALTALEAAHARAREGGGEREVTRHHARGKLLPRERIELLVDRDTALLELAATAGIPAGGGLVTAIGIVEQQECMIIGNDPTVREVGLTDAGRYKAERAVELARQYRLPVVLLWESMVEANEVVAHGCSPIISAIFGASDAPQQLTDHSVIIRGHGLPSHADSVAEDERDAVRLVRVAVRRLCQTRLPGQGSHTRGGLPAGGLPLGGRGRGGLTASLTPNGDRATAVWGGGVPPRHEADDLLAVHRADLAEVLARVLDASEFDELRPHRGSAIIAGFGAVHGHRVAVLGNRAPDVDPESLYKAIELSRQAEMAGLPVVALASCGNGDEPLLSRALSSGYQISILLDENPPAWALASKGLRFSWPTPAWQIHDGVIDPRDTRTVLGICLSAMGERS